MKVISVNKLTIIAMASFAALSLCSCKGSGKVPASNGEPYEILAPVERVYWVGEIGDTLRSIFGEPVPATDEHGTRFELNKINIQAFHGLYFKHRNILLTTIDSTIKKPMLTVKHDFYAIPQIVVNITAPNVDSMVKYLSENRTTLLELFETAELDRAADTSTGPDEGAAK